MRIVLYGQCTNSLSYVNIKKNDKIKMIISLYGISIVSVMSVQSNSRLVMITGFTVLTVYVTLSQQVQDIIKQVQSIKQSALDMFNLTIFCIIKTSNLFDDLVTNHLLYFYFCSDLFLT